MKLSKFAKVAMIAGTVAAAAMPFIASATTLSLEDTGGSLGLGTSDLRATVLNIIRLLLGLMTLIAVSLIIYGGFIWMTAAGNEDNIEKAKRIITAAVIGLVVILLAWAIVIFVANTTTNVTV